MSLAGRSREETFCRTTTPPSAVDLLNHEDQGDLANQHRLDIRLVTVLTRGASPIMPPVTDHVRQTC
jgi:hypothetical protein